MPQGTDSWFSDVFFVSGTKNGVYQGLHPIRLGHQGLVLAVVAGQIGKGASSTSQHIDVIRAQLINQNLQDTIEALL